ncbi:MAG: DUF4350 domain-containing protein [Ginsengibacter sp.]
MAVKNLFGGQAVCFAFLFLFGCGRQERQLPPLKETFQKNDKKPFGSFVAYHQFKNIFNGRYVETIQKPFDESWNVIREYSADGPALYVLITKNLAVSKLEADAMLAYIKEGNELFISADYIDVELLNRLNCRVERDSEIIAEVSGKMKETYLEIIHPGKEREYFSYYYYPFLNSLSEYDSTESSILGLDELARPNFMLFDIGKGKLFLHTAPRAFSNYFLLSKSNYRYFEEVVSNLGSAPANIYWDEYYKSKYYGRPGNQESSGSGKTAFSSFNVINKNPPLLWAFCLSVLTIMLFILFNVKRKQRIIHETIPNHNTTVVFTETVGRLYLEKKNNKNIAEKMITYFYEKIRNKYFVNTERVNEELVNVLSRKSGIQQSTVQDLFDTIANVQSQENISDQELLSLNRQVQNFYKNVI